MPSNCYLQPNKGIDDADDDDNSAIHFIISTALIRCIFSAVRTKMKRIFRRFFSRLAVRANEWLGFCSAHTACVLGDNNLVT